MPMSAGDSFFRQITESFSELIFLYNAGKNRIVFSNRPLEWFMGNEAGRYESPTFFLYIPPHSIDKITQEWGRCFQLKQSEKNDFICPIRNPDGRETTLHFQATGVTASDGAPGVLFLVTSVSANDMNRLSRLIDQYKENYVSFIDMAAHDLLSPLRKLSVLAERLVSKYENANPDVQTHVARIESCIDNVRSLIKGLSELAALRVDPGHFSECDLQEILQEIIKEMPDEIKNRQAVIEAGSLPVIKGSRNQLHQLLKHIIGNALVFTKANPVQITIHSSPCTDEEKKRFALNMGSGYHRIEIADNGIGFNSDDAERIFEPFARLNGKSAFPGNGLGLAVSRRIAESHGGVIYAQGEENAGARFIIILPETPFLNA
jgi:signal transduction histidine kinase